MTGTFFVNLREQISQLLELWSSGEAFMPMNELQGAYWNVGLAFIYTIMAFGVYLLAEASMRRMACRGFDRISLGWVRFVNFTSMMFTLAVCLVAGVFLAFSHIGLDYDALYYAMTRQAGESNSTDIVFETMCQTMVAAVGIICLSFLCIALTVSRRSWYATTGEIKSVNPYTGEGFINSYFGELCFTSCDSALQEGVRVTFISNGLQRVKGIPYADCVLPADKEGRYHKR